MRSQKNLTWNLLCLVCLLVFVAGCQPLLGTPPPSPLEGYDTTGMDLFPPTRTPFSPAPGGRFPATPTGVFAQEQPGEIAQEPTAIPTSTATLEPVLLPTQEVVSETGATLWIEPSLPAGLQQALAAPEGYSLALGQEVPPPGARVLEIRAGAGQPVSAWVYALVAPFPTVEQGVSFQELKDAWLGTASGPFGQPLLMDESTFLSFSQLWGAPAQDAVEVAASADLGRIAWGRRPAWALVPFEALGPGWKVLEIDGVSPLRKEFDAAAYPLTLPVSVAGNAEVVADFLSRFGPGSSAVMVPPTNRDPNRLTVVALTGVTALVRATAFTMEQNGILYPGKDVRGILRNADIAHVSNEIPFAANCPFPDPVQQGLRFCSDPRYIELLQDIGTDIVELTGDHFQDWGEDAMLYTLDLYKELGWATYGGGANLEEARQAYLIEHNGNRLAFIGCNAKGGSYAQASATHPGAVKCNFDWMVAEISRLRQEGYLPLATFQHFEYYNYRAQPNQVQDSRLLAQAGAVVVSGSQAHQPQAFEFVGDSLIHYGLGNLFFDQYDVSEACRQGFIDLHVFYDGRYIGAELVPILFVDYARPRLMTPQEARQLMNKLFAASGW